MGGTKVHLHAFGFGPRLVAELDQRHKHGEAQAAHEDVEDPGHVRQAQGLRRLVLWSAGGLGAGRRRGCVGQGGEVEANGECCRWLSECKKVKEGKNNKYVSEENQGEMERVTKKINKKENSGGEKRDKRVQGVRHIQ